MDTVTNASVFLSRVLSEGAIASSSSCEYTDRSHPAEIISHVVWHEGKTAITYHAPHALSLHPRYAGDPTNAAFVSGNLDELLLKADLWLHGHVHNSFDYWVGGCRVVANPLGYAGNRNKVAKARDLKFENPAFQWACVIDVNSQDAATSRDTL